MPELFDGVPPADVLDTDRRYPRPFDRMVEDECDEPTVAVRRCERPDRLDMRADEPHTDEPSTPITGTAGVWRPRLIDRWLLLVTTTAIATLLVVLAVAEVSPSWWIVSAIVVLAGPVRVLWTCCVAQVRWDSHGIAVRRLDGAWRSTPWGEVRTITLDEGGRSLCWQVTLRRTSSRRPATPLIGHAAGLRLRSALLAALLANRPGAPQSSGDFIIGRLRQRAVLSVDDDQLLVEPLHLGRFTPRLFRRSNVDRLVVQPTWAGEVLLIIEGNGVRCRYWAPEVVELTQPLREHGWTAEIVTRPTRG